MDEMCKSMSYPSVEGKSPSDGLDVVEVKRGIPGQRWEDGGRYL